MAGNGGSKEKILAIIDILRELSDEEHPITAGQIMEELARQGLSAERKAIYSDIDLLIDRGFDIIKNPSPVRGYYLGERDFQIAEARLLVDAVQSAQFISESKTEDLIGKIEKSMSKYQRESLRLQQVYIDNRNKNTTETIYYVIDDLSRAVQSNKKVCIHYIKRRIEAGERPKNEEHIYNVTPYALIWMQDHYYLVCNNAKYDNLMHLRIDRIKKATILEEKGRPLSEVSSYKNHFDAADYISKVFNMFSGEQELVKLECKNEAWEIIRDRFGEDVHVFERTDDTFTIAANAVTNGLAAWIVQYGDMIVVKEPATLRDSVIKLANAALKGYKQ